ncbi:hypothetical protein QZH41_017471 [Actinostola sp. cb2023]|nr:hypothetical protein QZH41_017471 [Actinostola sp. cb2023]
MMLCGYKFKMAARTRTFAVCRRSLSSVSRHKKASATRADKVIDRIIRVDHAGELGADRIYAGQYAVLRNTRTGSVIKEMWDQEKIHLKTFEKLITERRTRPTLLHPVWNVAGYLLGAGTALLGKEAAMACTVAIEEVIGNHYDKLPKRKYRIHRRISRTRR